MNAIDRTFRRKSQRRPRHRARDPPFGAELRAAAGRADARRGLLSLGHRRQALRRHDERLFGRQPRPRASAHPRGAHRAGEPPRGAVARLLQRPARAVPRRDLPAHRARCRHPDEHRRRGGRDRREGGAPLGLPRQGHRQGQGRDHRRRRQLPRPHHHDYVVLDRARLSRRLRPVHAGLQGGAVRRPRRGRARDHARDRGGADRADPGRGRHHRAARRLSRGPAPHLRRAQRAAHPRRGAVGARPHRQVVRLRARGHPAGRARSSARRWAAACCRCRPSSARAN